MSQSDDEGTELVPRDEDRDDASGAGRRGRRDEPDVLLDVAELRVDEISLEVEELTAHVSLQADVLDLLRLHVGVDATLGRVQLTIKGVEAKAVLKVRLDNVARILDRVLTTIDNNPEIIGQLVAPVGQAAGEVAAGADEVVDDLAAGAVPAIAEVGEQGTAAIGEVGAGAGEVVEGLGQGIAAAEEDLAEDASRPSPSAERGSGGRPRRRAASSSEGGSAKRARRSRDRGDEEEG